MENKRSVELTLISLIVVIWSCWRLFYKNIHMALDTLSNFVTTASETGVVYTIFSISYYPIFSICLLAGGVGLFFQKAWSRNLVQSIMIIDICVRLYGMFISLELIWTLMKLKFGNSLSLLLNGLFILLVDILILYLINISRVKKQFQN